MSQMFQRGVTLLRWSLIPGATKGWNPASFRSVSRAMEFAMASKRMKFAWLAQATRIPIDRLKSAVRTNTELSDDEVRKVEMYLGVPVKPRKVNSVRSSPP